MDNPLSQPALVRRETLNRLEIGSGDKYSEWYQAPNTNLKVPGSTCTQVRDIHFSKLGRKEKEDALRTCDPQGLQACLTRLHELYLAKGSKKDKTDHLGLVLQGFVNFADVFTSVMTSILGAAPPEYQAAFSVVTFIYKGVKEKGDREEKLSGYLQSVIPMISQKQFYHDNIQTPRMRDAFLSFCTAIIKFVIAADKFCSRLAIVKLLIASTTNDPLQPYYDNINQCADTIESLRTAASLALLLEERQKTELIAKVLLKLYENSTLPTMTPEATAITALARYKAMHRCQKLCDILWPERYNPGQEKDFNSRERIHLAPRDQWEYHASAIQFPEWQQQDPRPLFWISGPESAEGLSWVSSFSVDLIDALAINESLATTYVFCRNGWDQLWTPALVLKRMIAQVLEAFHQIVIDHVSVLSTRRFRDLGDNAWEAWDLFCDILGILQDIMTQRGSELYIVIDRLDLCKTIDEDFSVKSHFIPLLQGLSQNYKATRVVLTSTVQAERLETLHQGEKLLRSVWIDVEHAVSMDDANAYDEWD